MWYDVTSIRDECVSVNVKIEREVKNISNSSELIGAYMEIDEWGFSAAYSSIQRCEIIDGDGKKFTCRGNNVDRDNPRLTAQTEKIRVPAGGVATLVIEFTEIKRENDQIVSVFHIPTKSRESISKLTNSIINSILALPTKMLGSHLCPKHIPLMRYIFHQGACFYAGGLNVNQIYLRSFESHSS